MEFLLYLSLPVLLRHEFGPLVSTVSQPYPTLLQLRALKIHRLTFLNYTNFVDRRILRLCNCETAGRELFALGKELGEQSIINLQCEMKPN